MNTSRKMGFGLLGISSLLFSIAAYLNHGLVGFLLVAGSSALITSAAFFADNAKP